MEKLAGKRLLVVGVCDDRKNFVFDVAKQHGVQCCSIGPVAAELIQDKVSQHICYDMHSHRDEQKHCDVIVDLVQRHFGDVDGCVTFWDATTPLTALLCGRLGTPGIPYSGAVAANKKSLTMERVRQSLESSEEGEENYCSLSYIISSLDDLEWSSKNLAFPAVLKTDYGAGGMSVKTVDNLEESKKHFLFLQSLQDWHPHQQYLGTMFGKDCVLMELLKGTEHAVDVVLLHGELVCAFVRDNRTQTVENVTVHVVNVLPSVLPPQSQHQLVGAAVRCCKALGLDHGVFNADIMLTESGPKLMEINARMTGLNGPHSVRLCYNVDLVGLTFLLACDIKPNIPLGETTFTCDGTPRGAVSPDSETKRATYKNPHVFSAGGLQDVPETFSPKPACTVVGRTVYAWQNESALRSTAEPEILQQVHDEGKVQFIPYMKELMTGRYEPPYCTLAVSSHSLSDAMNKLDRVFEELGLQ